METRMEDFTLPVAKGYQREFSGMRGKEVLQRRKRKQRVVEVVDVDEDEEMGEPVSNVRGQKRDRGVGGDEDEEIREDGEKKPERA